jgi:hypothetical protein
MATTRSKIVAELIGTAGTIDTAKLTDNAVTVAKLATALNLSSNTITLPLGVGGTDWSSSVQTDNFNAEANKGYYVNSTNKIITVTLPSNPTVGQIISIVDVTGTADTNPILLNPNGKQINGVAAELELATERSGVQIAYSGHDTGEFGWVVTDSANDYTVSDKTSTSTGILVVATPIITELRNLASEISPGGKPYFQAAGNTIEIIGRNFKSDAAVVFRGVDNSTTYNPASTTFNSSTKITTTIPAGMIPSSTPADGFDPFDVTVTNGSTGLNKTFRLDDSLEWLPTPAFQVPAGSLGELFRTENMTQLKDIQATGGNFTQFNARTQKVDATSLDTGDVITHTVSSGSLPTGVSIATDGTLSGTVTAPLAGKTISTFTVQASAASEISGDTETIEQTRDYSVTSIGTRVTGINPSSFNGAANAKFDITGVGFSQTGQVVKAAGSGGLKFVNTTTGLNLSANTIGVVSDTQLTVSTNAPISELQAGSGIDIVVELSGSTDTFKLSDETSHTLLTAPKGITVGTPTTFSTEIASADRGNGLSSSYVIPSASDANLGDVIGGGGGVLQGGIVSHTLDSAGITASDSSDATWMTYNSTTRALGGNIPDGFMSGGGTLNIPIKITDNANNELVQNYIITVASQGFSYPLGISHSAMFDGSSFLSFNPSSNTNSGLWTYSLWLKLSDFSEGVLLEADTSFQSDLRFDNGQLEFFDDGGNNFNVESSMLFRDTSAWYHLVVVVNSSLSTEKIKIYVNGSPISFSTDIQTNFTLNDTTKFNNSADEMRIGARSASSLNINGYMANIDFIDGQGLSADYFGKTQDGIWVAKAYDGTTNELGDATNVEYGTNGFKLTFADSGDLGKDTAPLIGAHSAANNWTNN